MREDTIFLTTFSFSFCPLYHLKTMAILERSDVQISDVSELGFVLSTNTEKYSLVRNYLKNLQSDWNLPVRYASEELCEIMASMPQVIFELTYGKVDTDKLIKEEPLPPRYDNKFVISGSLISKVGKNREKMMELANEIKSRLETLDLVVGVQEDSISNKVQEDEEIEYATPLVISVTMEIILKSFLQLSGEQDLWKNIPEETREILVTANTDGAKYIVRKSEFIMRGLNAICVDLAKRVDDALKEYKKSHFFPFETTFEKNPDAAIKELGDFDGKREARGFLQLLDLYYVFNVK